MTEMSIDHAVVGVHGRYFPTRFAALVNSRHGNRLCEVGHADPDLLQNLRPLMCVKLHNVLEETGTDLGD